MCSYGTGTILIKTPTQGKTTLATTLAVSSLYRPRVFGVGPTPPAHIHSVCTPVYRQLFFIKHELVQRMYIYCLDSPKISNIFSSVKHNVHVVVYTQEELNMKHINVGEIIQEHKCYEGRDDELDTHILD
jgi:hypothetical protein